MIPLPGTKAAQNRGCMCPAEENQKGKGVAHNHDPKNGVHFCIARDCPLHGQSTWMQKRA